jgi:hypothetical protein
MDDHITPLVWSTLAQYGMRACIGKPLPVIPSIAWGVAISLKRVERLTYRFGHLGLFRRKHWVNQLRQGDLPLMPVLKDQRVVISVDGGRTRKRPCQNR